MSANADAPLSPGTILTPYRLVQRVGSSSVWKAEDSRNGKNVALKLLNRHLTHDPGRRESLLRELRQNAAVPHPNLVTIQEIVAAGDDLLLIMEWFEGMPISAAVNRGLPNGEQCFRVAYQLFDALQALHDHNALHGNITGDTVIVGGGGRVKLSGFNLGNLGRQQDAGVSARLSEPRAVSYMAPEQVSGEAVDNRSDVYSAGVVFYEMATGRLPFGSGSASEIATRVLKDQAPSPKTLNPEAEPSFVSLLGRCLYRDPFRRPQAAKQITQEMRSSHPAVAEWARQSAVAPRPAAAKAEVTPQAAHDAESRGTILWMAELANAEDLAADGEESVSRAVARMQQILGEAAYFYDGKVIDPFARRMLADLPDPSRALDAARKGAADLAESDPSLQVRMLLHVGNASVSGASITGPAVDQGVEVLGALSPGRLVASSAFVKAIGGARASEFRRVGNRGGAEFFEVIVVAAPPPAVGDETVAVSPAPAPAPGAKVVAAPAEQPRVATKRPPIWVAIAAAALVVVVAAAGIFMWQKKSVVSTKQVVEQRIQPPTAAHPRTITLQPFSVQDTDPIVAARAEAVRLAAADILLSFPELHVSDSPVGGGLSISATVRTTPTGPELIATEGSASAQPVALSEVAAPVQGLVSWIRTRVGLPNRRLTESPAAINSYSDALASFAKDGPNAQTETALKAALQADPRFLPVQLLALRVAQAKGDEHAAAGSAKEILALDGSRTDAMKVIARSTLADGDLATSFSYWKQILQHDQGNTDALNVFGRYAVAVGDEARFGIVLQRLRANPEAAAVHEPDLLVASGRFEPAIDKYYDVEVGQPRNAALALKIGRIAVLRHTIPIAELELKKLEQLDPAYGAHVLAAYMAAQKGSRAEAEKELSAAHAGSKPGDDFFTSSAEIAAMFADNPGAVKALESALARREPTAAYVLNDPLFRYMGSDPAFQALRAKFEKERGEIAAALGQVQL